MGSDIDKCSHCTPYTAGGGGIFVIFEQILF